MTSMTNVFNDISEKTVQHFERPITSTALHVAACIIKLYTAKFDSMIDEMKLHKLLYFVQRETLAKTGVVAFEEEFRAWKFGPVILCVREAYKSENFPDLRSFEFADVLEEIIDNVFENYADRSSWALSDITHGELSWRNARKGIPDGENGNNPMALSDIRKDAERLKYSRACALLRGAIDEYK